MTRILRDSDIRSIVDFPEAVNRMEEGYELDARGDVVAFPRSRLAAGSASLAWLGAAIPSAGVLGFRSYLHSTGGQDRGEQMVTLYGLPDMELRAIFLGRLLSDLRTGATLAAALRLAEPQEHEVGLIGTGGQARNALACISATMRPSRVLVWSPTPDHREEFRTWAARVLNRTVELATNARDVARKVSSIVFTTAADQTILSPDDVSDRHLLISIGAYRRPELAPDILDRVACVWTDSISQAGGPGTVFESEARRRKLIPLGKGVADGSIRNHSVLRIVVNTGAAWEEVLMGKFLSDLAEANHVGTVVELSPGSLGLLPR